MAQKRKFERGGKGAGQKQRGGRGKKWQNKQGLSKPKVPQAAPQSSDDESGEEAPLVEGVTAYQALLSQLHSSGGRNAQAVQQRLKEQQGGDTESNSDEDVPLEEEDRALSEEDGSEEDALRDDLGSDLEGDESGSESEEPAEENDERKTNGAGKVGKLSQKEEELGGEENASDDGREDAGSDDELAESDDDLEEDEERRASNGTASTSLATDPFEIHMNRELSQAEVTVLENTASRKFTTSVQAESLPASQWVSDRGDLAGTPKALTEAGVRARLVEQWRQLHKRTGKMGDFTSPLQAQFFGFCANYCDIFHHQKPLPETRKGATEEAKAITDAVLLHAMNHVIKTRERIIKNNTRLHKQSGPREAEDEQQNEQREVLPEDSAPRDQGFTRPKVLFVLPYRSVALKVVKRMLELLPPAQKASVEHHARFLDDFGVEDDDEDDLLQKAKKARNGDPSEEAEAVLTGAKPAEHRALFSGNNDDHFRIGIKFTRKSVKLYSDFYTSDVIVASPLGLTTRIAEAEGDKDADIDFLSSIEVVVIDYAEVIYMQNWQNLVIVLEHLNRLPTKQHGSDLMRTREWYLNGWAKFYRQTIMLSSITTPEMNALFHRHCFNAAGRIKLKTQSPGVLSKVIPRVRQLFERVPCGNIAEADDARFDYFTKQVFPRIKDSVQGGVLIFARSYFEFVRLRNFLRAQNAQFASLCEYTKQSDISRGRAWFFHGKRQFLVYTERAHFYHRYRIRGIKDLVFYSLPEFPNYYAELLNLLEGTDAPTCTALFTQQGDNLELERIVGTSRARKMFKSENKTFMFC